MHHIFLSPHLDDAVFSCGGTIASLINNKDKVTVITINTASPLKVELPKKLQKFANYDERLLEDHNALNFLKTDFFYWGYTERAFAKPEITSLKDIFSTPKEGLEGFKNIERIKNDIDNLFKKNENLHIYVPLGIGNHYDHLELFIAALQYIKENYAYNKFSFYEDAYTYFGNALRQRHLIASAKLFTTSGSPVFMKLQGAIIGQFFKYAQNQNSIKGDLSQLVKDLSFKMRLNPIKQFEETKLHAMELYSSQIASFGGMHKIAPLVKKYHRFWGMSEPLWRIKT